MEAAVCDLCGENDFTVARVEQFTRFSDEAWYPVVTCVCTACGHVFMSPRMTRDEITEHYRKQYRESFQQSRGERIGLNEADAGFVERELGRGNGRRALEVGCYTGYLLNHLDEMGWDVEGIDPNPDSVSEARETFGFSVHVAMLEDFEPDGHFDLVFIAGVLEHVRSPTDALLKINQLLKDGGHVFVRVPNVEEIQLETVGDVFHVDHPHMFSPNSLEMFLEKAGFQRKAMTAHEEFKRNIVCLARKGTDSAEPLEFQVDNQHDRVLSHIRTYSEHIERERNRVDEKLAPLYDSSPSRVALYGAGSHTEFLFRYTDIERADVVCLFDSNPDKWGSTFLGYPVRNPDVIDGVDLDAVVVSSRAFQDEIYQDVKYLEDEEIDVIRLYDTEQSRYPTG